MVAPSASVHGAVPQFWVAGDACRTARRLGSHWFPARGLDYARALWHGEVMDDLNDRDMPPTSPGSNGEARDGWRLAAQGVQRTPRRPRALQRRRPKGHTRRMQVLVETELADALEAQAEAERLSLSGLVARMLRDHLRQHPLRAR